jgi:hypothetical protein
MPPDKDVADPNQRYVDWIIDGLRNAGKSQHGLATAMGVSPTVVSRIAKGRRPVRARELAVISRYLAEPRWVAKGGRNTMEAVGMPDRTHQPNIVVGTPVRFRVQPRDVPAVKAARRLHLTQAEFEACLPELTDRGFPRADPTTGMYDLNGIDAWMDLRVFNVPFGDKRGFPRSFIAPAKSKAKPKI